MATQKISLSAAVQTLALRGTQFALLSGAPVKATFYGVRDNWQEIVDVGVGDVLTFPAEFGRIELTAEFNTLAEIYAGRAAFSRNRLDVSTAGTSTIYTRGVDVPKTEQMLVSPRAGRRSVLIIPLDGNIYVGGYQTSQNDKIPVPAGSPFSIDTEAALYASADPDTVADTVNVRILEEVN
ncbi:hypothetical protein O1O06_11875 [Grimontia hollisae]|uniref:hypothetical protein n=1 Tax=Grimontia hollisae TaxID=673 RepID=UPI0023DA1B6F|nr:hypothetical protein [Grimontia hollisae]MDF2185461.1 hypothetical protein [Grimontia hollisae]